MKIKKKLHFNWTFAKIGTLQHSNITRNGDKPMLLSVPTQGTRLSLHSLEDKVYPYQFPIATYRQDFIGASHGWLALGEKDSSITLLNPFSGKTQYLPPLEGENQYPGGSILSKIEKVILSRDPSLHPDDYVVAAIYHYGIAFIKSGEKSWTYVDDDQYFSVYDICFYKGQLCAIDCYRQPFIIDSSGNVATLCPMDLSKAEESSYYILDSSCRGYLVESYDGDLLLVHRFIIAKDNEYHADFFYPFYSHYKVHCEYTVAFKLLMNQSSDEGNIAKWVELDNLEDFIFFLGYKDSICIAADAGFPYCMTEYCIDANGLEVHYFELKSKGNEKCYEVPDSIKDVQRLAFWILPTPS